MTEEPPVEPPSPSPESAPPPLDPAPAPAPAGTSAGMSANTWAMFCHFAAFAGLFIPFGNVLGPLIVWMIKKDELPVVDRHGKTALNFQLTIAILTVAVFAASVVLSVIGIGFLTGFAALVAYYVAILVFPLVGGLQANEGKDYRYPFSFNLIR